MKFRKTALVLAILLFLGLFSFASFVPITTQAISSKYLHMEDGYLYYNLHFQSEQGMINQSNPESTDWHELYPEFSRRYRLYYWEDTNGDGIISWCDQICMYDRETFKKYWYHVERVTVYLNVTLEPERTRWMKIEFKGEKWEWEMMYQYEPLGTLWHEVYPVYSNVYKLTSYTEGSVPPDGKVSYCDTIDMTDVNGTVTWYHVEDVATGLILSRKKTEPVSTQWHELRPIFSTRYRLSGWKDTGPPIGVLSPSDQINLTLKIDGEPIGPTGEYHVDNETITLNVTLGTTWMAIEFELPPGAPLEEMYLPITRPVCTKWHEVYPIFSKRYHLSGWMDNCDGVLSHCDYINLTDIETGGSAWYHVEDVTNDIGVSPIVPPPPPPPPPPMFWKANYTDYAPSGMPDFDQKQDLWNVSGWVWTWCAPVAVANSLWWMDSRYETNMTPPPTIKDTFPLVSNYTVGIDDHDPKNVPLFIKHLGYLMDTDGNRTKIAHTGTWVWDMETGIAQYLSWTGLNPKGDVNGDGKVNQTDWNIVNASLGSSVVGGVPQPGPQGQPWNMAADIWPATLGWPKLGVADNKVNASDLALVTANNGSVGKFYEQTVPMPDFYFVEKEVERSEDVILLLGFWQWTGADWYRENYPYDIGSGHAVTVAGVNSTTLQIAISDPIQDNAEPPPQGTSGPGRVLPPPPHPHTGIPETLHNNATYVSQDIYNITWLGPVPPPPPPPAGNWSLKNYASPQYPGPWIAVVEWAVIVSPLPPVGVHDVAVTAVTRSVPKEKLSPGNATILDVHAGTWSLYVNVTVKNVGNFNETFTVKAYYDGVQILPTKTVTNLAPGASIRLDFSWSPGPGLVHFDWTPGVKKYTSIYTVKGEAVLAGDANPGDNVKVDGKVRVIFLADVNMDGTVSGGDGALVGGSWYKKPGQPGYLALADVNFDAIVSGGDGALIGANWYKTAPP